MRVLRSPPFLLAHRVRSTRGAYIAARVSILLTWHLLPHDHSYGLAPSHLKATFAAVRGVDFFIHGFVICGAVAVAMFSASTPVMIFYRLFMRRLPSFGDRQLLTDQHDNGERRRVWRWRFHKRGGAAALQATGS